MRAGPLTGRGRGRGRTGAHGQRLPECAGRVACAPFASVDPLTPLARVTDLPRTGPLALEVPRLRREAALLTAAQQLGSAARTVEMAVRHAREREQFGAPVGSFQAVKHLCAQMLVRAEMARSAVYAAAVTESALEVTAAKLLADEAAVPTRGTVCRSTAEWGSPGRPMCICISSGPGCGPSAGRSAREAEELLAAGLIA